MKKKEKKKGNSKAERLKKWHDYFKGLLGDPPTITDSEGLVNTILRSIWT